MTLGDLGAEVVKVERPGVGDETRRWGPPFAPNGESAYYLAVNRNKRSVALDLKSDEGQATARQLASRADVLVHNFIPGRIEGFGLGYEGLRSLNPQLVYCTITGFGANDMPGYDFLVQAASGYMSITGEPTGPPLKTGVAVVDVLTGLNATIGVLAALEARSRTGEGQRVEVDLMTSALSSLVNQASNYLVGGLVPSRIGNLHPNISPYESFETVTEPIAIAVGNDRQFLRLSEALGLTRVFEARGISDNASRIENREFVTDRTAESLRRASAEEWLALLQKVGVPCAPVNDIKQAFEFAESLDLNPVVSLPSSTGSIPTVRSPINLSGTPVSYRLPPPLLGEHHEDPFGWMEAK